MKIREYLSRRYALVSAAGGWTHLAPLAEGDRPLAGGARLRVPSALVTVPMDQRRGSVIRNAALAAMPKDPRTREKKQALAGNGGPLGLIESGEKVRKSAELRKERIRKAFRKGGIRQ